MAILLSLFQVAFLLSNVWTSYKTLKPPPISRRRETPSTRAIAARKRELKACLAVWIVWATWSCAERIADRTVGILIPFYTDIKTIFLVVLFFTRAMIAEPLLLHFIRPTLKPYISTIDATLDLLSAISHIVAHFALAPWRYLTSPSAESPESPDEETGHETEATIQDVGPAVPPIEPEPVAETQAPIVPEVVEMPPPRSVPSRMTSKASLRPLEISGLPAPVGTRARRGIQATSVGQPPNVLRNTVRLRLEDSPIEIPQPAPTPPPQPFIVQRAIPRVPSVQNVSQPAPLPTPPSPAPIPLPQHIINPAITRSPRFPGGYAMSATDQSETDQSSTMVQSAPTHSPSAFSFPEPPPIEVFAPGSSRPSEVPRTRLRTISARSPQTHTVPPLAKPVVVPVSIPTPAPTPPIEAARPILSRQSTTRFEPAPSASSATAAAEAKRATRTYAMYEPTLAKTAMPLKREPSVSQAAQTESEAKHPVSSATFARRQRLASTSSLREPQQHQPGSTPLSALEPTIATSRAKQPQPQAAAPAAAELSSASSSASTSSKRSGVSAGKKRSAKGHVVESPRLPPSASEAESATEGDNKTGSAESAKKKRKIEDETPVVSIPLPPSPPPEPVMAVPQAVPQIAPQTIPPTVPETVPSIIRPIAHPAVAALKVIDDRSMSEDDDYSDDESWSALDELRTPNHKARSLRSRTVFSDDETSVEPLPPVPTLPRPTLPPLHIPEAPVTKQTQARQPSHLHATYPTNVSDISSVSDFLAPDAFATIAAVRGGNAKDTIYLSKDKGLGADIENLRYSSRTGNNAGAPPITVSKGNAAAAARGRRLRSTAGRI